MSPTIPGALKYVGAVVLASVTAYFSQTYPAASQAPPQDFRELQANVFKTFAQERPVKAEESVRKFCFAAGDKIGLAEFYSSADKVAPEDRLVLYLMKSTETVKEPQRSEKAQAKFVGNFNPDLIITTCGRDFGDDQCDRFDRLNEKLRIGGFPPDQKDPHAITHDDKNTLKSYLQSLDRIFTKSQSAR